MQTTNLTFCDRLQLHRDREKLLSWIRRHPFEVAGAVYWYGQELEREDKQAGQDYQLYCPVLAGNLLLQAWQTVEGDVFYRLSWRSEQVLFGITPQTLVQVGKSGSAKEAYEIVTAQGRKSYDHLAAAGARGA